MENNCYRHCSNGMAIYSFLYFDGLLYLSKQHIYTQLVFTGSLYYPQLSIMCRLLIAIINHTHCF